MSVALPLPPALAAALDADGEILVRHPTTGAQLRLVPGPASGGDGAGAERPAGGDRFFDSEETLAEEVDAAIAEADAGLGRPWAEVRAELLTDLPFLNDAAAETGKG